jgi:hypothetical protein
LEIVGAAPGKQISLKYDGPSSGVYLALASGLTTVFVEIKDKRATLPEKLQGTVYAIVSKSNTALADAQTVAGPAILGFPFSSSAVNYA